MHMSDFTSDTKPSSQPPSMQVHTKALISPNTRANLPESVTQVSSFKALSSLNTRTCAILRGELMTAYSEGTPVIKLYF